MAKAPPVDKRRQILDGAIHVFARQGFHASRVSDIAREARSGMERDPWLGAAARRRSSYWPVIGTGGAGTGPSMM